MILDKERSGRDPGAREGERDRPCADGPARANAPQTGEREGDGHDDHQDAEEHPRIMTYVATLDTGST